MTLQQLEKTISELSADEFAKFREWFLAFDAEKWDQQFENDVAAGRLDQLAMKQSANIRPGNRRAYESLRQS